MTGVSSTGEQPPARSGLAGVRGWAFVDRPLSVISILLLVFMVGLTTVDVVARYWFDSPVNGAFELTQMMLAGLIFAALPITTAAGEHVDVELFTLALGAGVERVLLAFGDLVTALVLGAIGWRLWVHADRLAHDGAVTNSLGISFAPIGWFAAFCCGLSVLASLLRLWRRFRVARA